MKIKVLLLSLVLLLAGTGVSQASTLSNIINKVKATLSSKATPTPTPKSVPVGQAPIGFVVGPGPTQYVVESQPAPGTCHYRTAASRDPLPDGACTPGAINPKVTQSNLSSTICRKGYTKSIRPTASITGKEKKANAKSYSYKGKMGDGEYDHLISLELGGDPNDPRNLWVEPASPGHVSGTGVNNPKDGVENKLKTAICSGQVTLLAAQQAISTDWTTALSSLKLN
jgi:hypothetical protein